MRFALISTAFAFALFVSASTGCNAPSGESAPESVPGSEIAFWKVKPSASPSASPAPTKSPAPTATPAPTTTASPAPTQTPAPSPTVAKTDALVFDGTGTSASNTQVLLDLIAAHGLTYRVVDSYQLAALTAAELASYRLIIWPGGNSITMNDALSASTRQKVRNAVISSGVNYVGFCAGAWMAVGPTPASGAAPYWGLSIVPGDYLKGYDPNGSATNPTAAMVALSTPSGTRSVVWWDSPYLWDIAGGVLARYPDGKAAMVQTQAGNGYVVLTGPHPEAPQSWRDAENLVDPDGLDTATAWSLIDAALNRRPLQVL